MTKGILKLLMLKIISEGDANGYQVIKRIEEVTGNRPSTGAVYPMLKDIRVSGLVSAKELDGRTFYSITPKGKERLEEYNRDREAFIRKIHESISIANETFDVTIQLEYQRGVDLTSPLIHKVHALLRRGVDARKIKNVLDGSIAELDMLLRRSSGY